MAEFNPDPALRPLDRQDDLNRGNSEPLLPPVEDISEGDENKTLISIADRCARGELINVVLGIELEGQSNTSQAALHPQLFYPSVRAILDWGIGGVSFHAECDFIMGTQLSICAENLRVGATYLKNTPPWDPVSEPDAPTFRVSAGFGYGNIGRNSNPARFTQLVQILSPGDTQIVQIPQYAISMTVLPVADGSADVRMYGFGSSYFVRYVVASPLTNAGQYNVENAFPIFNGARFVEIANTNDSDPLYAFVVFGLAL